MDNIPADFAALGALAQAFYNNSAAHGFWEDYDKVISHLDMTLGEFQTGKYQVDVKLSKLALVVSEVGEMVEGVRKPGPDQHCPSFTQEEVECADAIIRLLDYAAAFGLRIGDAVHAKSEYNKSRPYKHGKAA